ncbi:MAG TPA: hypothetical protein VF867_04335 [Arthrobacter sp.]
MSTVEITIGLAWAAAVGGAFLIRRHRMGLARTALNLADRRIWVLHPRRARRLENALLMLLDTPGGSTIAADPRITARLALFEEVRQLVDAVTSHRLQHRTLTRLNLIPINA